MWVRLMGWMIADDEPSLPAAGSLLTNVGLRIRGEVSTALPDAPDGISEVRGAPPHLAEYRLVGRIIGPRDVKANFGDGTRHAGVEFVLLAGAARFQVEADGWARDVKDGSRALVIGRLQLVGEYEWEAFDLGESRADWLVKEVVPADDDDVMLDLVARSRE